MNQPNNTENQETLIICNLTYFRSWHLREKVLWEVSVVIQRGFQGNFKSFIRLLKAFWFFIMFYFASNFMASLSFSISKTLALLYLIAMIAIIHFTNEKEQLGKN